MNFRISIFAICALGTATPLAASAQGSALNGADTAWVMVAAALVLFMTLPGLALFYGGLVRSKNVLSMYSPCMASAASWVGCLPRCLPPVLWAAGDCRPRCRISS